MPTKPNTAIVTDYLIHHGKPGSSDGDPTRLVHASCHRGHLTRLRGSTAQRT
jgi:RNA-directed DNA polymerase